MQASIAFLVDECLPFEVADAFTDAGYRVTHVLDSPTLRGSDDNALWALAARQGLVFVTRDLDFPIPDGPRPLGLILFRVPHWYSRQQLGTLTRRLLETIAAAQVTGRVVVVSPGREPRTRSLDNL